MNSFKDQHTVEEAIFKYKNKSNTTTSTINKE